MCSQLRGYEHPGSKRTSGPDGTSLAAAKLNLHDRARDEQAAELGDKREFDGNTHLIERAV